MGNDNGNTVFSRCGGMRMSNHNADPEKTRVWRYKQPLRMQLSIWGKRWVALADVADVWNLVLTACGCVDAISLVVVVVATSFVVVGSVMKKR